MSADAAVPRYRGALARQYRSELRLVLTRRRNLALLLVLALVPVLIGVAVKVSNPGGGEGPAFLDRITGNGLFLVFTALTVSIPFFLPLVIGVVSGDAIAGEAGQGTLRYVLTVPVGRGRLLLGQVARRRHVHRARRRRGRRRRADQRGGPVRGARAGPAVGHRRWAWGARYCACSGWSAT